MPDPNPSFRFKGAPSPTPAEPKPARARPPSRLMKKLIKLAFFLGVLAVIAASVGYLFRSVILRSWVERTLTAATGMEFQVGRLENPFLTSAVQVENLLVVDRRPPRPRTVFEIPSVAATIDVGALFRRQVRLLKVKVDIEELTVVRDRDGQVNLLAMLEAATRSPVPAPAFGFGGVDRMEVSITRVRYRDLGRPQDDDEAYLGLRDRSFQGLQTPADFRRVATELLADSRVRFFPKLGLVAAPVARPAAR